MNTAPIKKMLFSVSKPITKRVLELKNRHQGESCYLFGDGISLKWFDLAEFATKPTITLCYVPYHKQARFLDIRYGLMTEPKYFYPYRKLPWPPKTWWRNQIQNQYRQLMVENPAKEYFVNLSNYPVLSGNNIFYLFRFIDDSDFKFLNECLASNLGIYDGNFRCSIALAIYMGFEDITLVGCDYTHEISRALHWYEKGKGIVETHSDYQRPYLEIAQKYAKITTITMDGGGGVLPAVTYTEHTGRTPIFRENHELTDMETLKLLATWPDYSIL